MKTGHPDTINPQDLDLYALDALPAHEAKAVEAELAAAAPADRASMLAYIADTREVIADLVAFADLDTTPPAHLRQRILDRAASAPTGPDTSTRANVINLNHTRRRRRTGPITALTVAAAVALLAGGVVIGRVTHESGTGDLPLASPPAGSMPNHAKSLLAADDLAVVRGQIAGTGTATVLASKSADMAVISMTDLPEPAVGRAYQLWLMGDHQPIPAGTMEAGQVGPSPSAKLDGIRDSKQIGITEEPAGGSPLPTGPVLLALDIQ